MPEFDSKTSRKLVFVAALTVFLWACGDESLQKTGDVLTDMGEILRDAGTDMHEAGSNDAMAQDMPAIGRFRSCPSGRLRTRSELRSRSPKDGSPSLRKRNQTSTKSTCDDVRVEKPQGDWC